MFKSKRAKRQSEREWQIKMIAETFEERLDSFYRNREQEQLDNLQPVLDFNKLIVNSKYKKNKNQVVTSIYDPIHDKHTTVIKHDDDDFDMEKAICYCLLKHLGYNISDINSLAERAELQYELNSVNMNSIDRIERQRIIDWRY